MLRLGLLHGQALILWLHLKGLAWQHGECDPTDAVLAGLMGGVKHDLIRVIRRTLEANDLLLEYQRDGVRWLIPLPVPADARSHYSAAIWSQIADRQGWLRQRVAAPEVQQTDRDKAGTAQAPRNSPPGGLGPNSIRGQCLKEEEELITFASDNIPHPPFLTTRVSRAGERGVEGGGRSNGNYPQQDWGPIDMGDSSRGEQLAGEKQAPPHPDGEALCRFMADFGVFPSIARSLTVSYLARMPLAEAQAEVLGWAISIRQSHDLRDGKIDDETARGRLVARLREGAPPPAKALDEAWRTLEEIRESPADGNGDDGTKQADEPDEDSPALVESEDDGASEIEDGTLSMPVWQVTRVGQPTKMSAEEVWQLALAQVRLQMNASTYDLYLRSAECLGVEADGRTIVVSVAYQFAAQWLNHERGVRNQIRRTLRQLGLPDVDVYFEEA